MKLLPLSQGKYAKVDDDFETDHKWCFNGRYAVRSDRSGGKKKTVYMHREIYGASTELRIEHINGDSLDNRYYNLRIWLRDDWFTANCAFSSKHLNAFTRRHAL